MNPLKSFYSDTNMREAVKGFFIDVLKERAVEKVFNKQAIAGVYEARKTILEAFDKLDEFYQEQKPPLIDSSR